MRRRTTGYVPPKNVLPSTPRAKPWQIMHSGNAPVHAQFGVAPEIEMPCQ